MALLEVAVEVLTRLYGETPSHLISSLLKHFRQSILFQLSGSTPSNAKSADSNFRIAGLDADGEIGALLFLMYNFHQEMED